MDQTTFNTKQKILHSTLNIIEKEGFDRITVRKIAAKAEINAALINYHFGSKENLISQAIDVILGDARKAFEHLDNTDIEPAERLKKFLQHYAKVGMENPEALREVVLKGSFDYDSQKDYIYFIKTSGLRKVVDTVGEMTGICDMATLMMITLQLFGSMLIPIIMKPVIGNVLDFDIASLERTDAYFDILLGRYGAARKEEDSI